MKVVWSDNFSVGHNTIDGQHKKLVDMLNEANDILDSVKDNQQAFNSISHLLNELVEYSVYHFDAEEKIMQDYNYPGYPEHKEEHEKFKAKIGEILKEDFTVDTFNKTNELLKFLFKWLINHINYIDKKYTKYIQ